MASDIVPIQLSLTEGDLVTLWAPRWREDGEEWEAFLGDDESLFAFPEVAQLAAYVRTNDEHDLADHPAWSVVPDLSVGELTPEQTRRYDIVGYPELAAQDADTWTIGELAEITDMVRSLADVCDLETVTEVLDSTPGFALLEQGTLPFVGREGGRLWDELVDTIAERWDEVVDALDGAVRTPDLDTAALEKARDEAAELAAAEEAAAEADADEPLGMADDEPLQGAEADDEAEAQDGTAEDAAEEPAEPVGFWAEVGIDPIRITTSDGEFLTLRCYVDDKPLFLGSQGRIDVFGSPRALAKHVAGDGAEGHDLAEASTWPTVLARATDGDLDVEVDEQNDYVLLGLDHDLAAGPDAVDPNQLDLAVELVVDVADWAGDDEARAALAEAESLGWLVSYLIRPDPTRLAPSPPFDAEVAAWCELVDATVARLRQR